MLKPIAICTSVISGILWLVPHASSATTNDIHVTTNGANASSSVIVNNNQSNTSNSNTTRSNTNIHVESNGKSYTYTSDTPGSVSLQNHNGEVTVNGVKQETSSNKSTTPSPTQSLDAEKQMKKVHEQIEEAKKRAAEQKTAMEKKMKELKTKQNSLVITLLHSLKDLFHFK